MPIIEAAESTSTSAYCDYVYLALVLTHSLLSDFTFFIVQVMVIDEIGKLPRRVLPARSRIGECE